MLASLTFHWVGPHCAGCAEGHAADGVRADGHLPSDVHLLHRGDGVVWGYGRAKRGIFIREQGGL